MAKVITNTDKKIIRVSNEFLHSELSLAAKGLMMYMTTHDPNKYDFSIERMSHNLKEGKASITTALNELLAAHYVVRSTRRFKKEQHFITKTCYSLADIDADEKYAIISQDVLQHKAISLKAKAVYAIAWSLHKETHFTIQNLSEIIKTSIHSIRSSISELMNASFIQREQYHVNGRFSNIIYTFFDTVQETTAVVVEKTVKTTKKIMHTVIRNTDVRKSDDITKTYINKNERLDTITNSFHSFAKTLTNKQQQLLEKKSNDIIQTILQASNTTNIRNLKAYTIKSIQNYLKLAKAKYSGIVASNINYKANNKLELEQQTLLQEFRTLDKSDTSASNTRKMQIAEQYNANILKFNDNKRRERLVTFELAQDTATKDKLQDEFNKLFAEIM